MASSVRIAAAALIIGVAGPAWADEIIIVNGVPCNSLCRAGFENGLPPKAEIQVADDSEPASRDVEAPVVHHHAKRAHKKLPARAAGDTAAADPGAEAGESSEPPRARRSRESSSSAKHAARAAEKSASKAHIDVSAPPSDPPDAESDPARQNPSAALATSQDAATPLAASPASEASRSPSQSSSVAARPVASPEGPHAAHARRASAKARASTLAAPPTPTVASTPEPRPTVGSALEPLPVVSATPTPAPAPKETTKTTASSPNGGAPNPPQAERKEQDRGADKLASVNYGAKADELQIMIVLTQDDIESAAKLRGRPILFAGVTSITSDQAKASFAAAGAAGVELKTEGDADLGQVARGEVAGAVVAVVNPKVADDLSKMPSLHFLRIDVTPKPGA